MQETLHQTTDAVVSLSDSGCRSLIQTADAGDYQTADAGDSIRQRMQETLYQTAGA